MDRMSNMLSSLKNAAMAKRPYIEVFYSNKCHEVAKVLQDKGFLTEVKVFKPKEKAYKMLHLALASENLSEIKMISKPGRRVYGGKNEFGKVAGGYGVLIVSTSKGVMEAQEARKKKLGGEILCEVY